MLPTAATWPSVFCLGLRDFIASPYRALTAAPTTTSAYERANCVSCCKECNFMKHTVDLRIWRSSWLAAAPSRLVSLPNLCVSRGRATGAVITQAEQRRANRKPRSRTNHIPPALPLFRMNTSDVPTQSLHRAAPRKRRRRRKEAQTMGHPAGWISAYAHDKLVRGKVPGGRECMSTRNNE